MRRFRDVVPLGEAGSSSRGTSGRNRETERQIAGCPGSSCLLGRQAGRRAGRAAGIGKQTAESLVSPDPLASWEAGSSSRVTSCRNGKQSAESLVSPGCVARVGLGVFSRSGAGSVEHSRVDSGHVAPPGSSSRGTSCRKMGGKLGASRNCPRNMLPAAQGYFELGLVWFIEGSFEEFIEIRSTMVVYISFVV